MDLISTVLSCDTAAPRYTSYPPANHFQAAVDSRGHLTAIVRSNQRKPRAVSFYVHIPFCPHRCLFCGCNTEIGRPASYVQNYFRALDAEMDEILPLIEVSRPLTQIHFGGGTPNAVPNSALARILERLQRGRVVDAQAEIALECDPALLTPAKLAELRTMGFNRISYGVQDFDPAVLAIVERQVPRKPMEFWVDSARELGFGGINIDLIYGLPGQNEDGFARTIYRAAAMRPHRIALFSYAHVPWVKEHQSVLEKSGLPSAEAKVRMFLQARDILVAAGYLWIGMDHFVLPEDDLALANAQGELHRNFQGYCTRRTTGQIYGFGASAISQLEDAYAQNIHNSSLYTAALLEGKGALGRWLEVDRDAQLLRDLITRLMCNGLLDLRTSAQRHSTEPAALRDFLGEGWARLQALGERGLVQSPDEWTVVATEAGRLVVRYLAMQLDPLISRTGEQKVYSRTV